MSMRVKRERETKKKERVKYPEGWWQSQIFILRLSWLFPSKIICCSFSMHHRQFFYERGEKRWMRSNTLPLFLLYSLELRLKLTTTYNWSNILLRSDIERAVWCNQNWMFCCRRRVVVGIKCLLLFLHNHLYQISPFALYSSLRVLQLDTFQFVRCISLNEHRQAIRAR